MADHPNVELVKNLLEAFNSRDVETVAAAFAPDITWHTIGGNTINGVEELAASMSVMTDDGASVQTEVHDVVGNDDHVIALVEATASSGGESFVYRTAEIMHVSDGKITERWAFSDDTQRIIDFFSQFDG